MISEEHYISSRPQTASRIPASHASSIALAISDDMEGASQSCILKYYGNSTNPGVGNRYGRVYHSNGIEQGTGRDDKCRPFTLSFNNSIFTVRCFNHVLSSSPLPLSRESQIRIVPGRIKSMPILLIKHTFMIFFLLQIYCCDKICNEIIL